MKDIITVIVFISLGWMFSELYTTNISRKIVAEMEKTGLVTIYEGHEYKVTEVSY